MLELLQYWLLSCGNVGLVQEPENAYAFDPSLLTLESTRKAFAVVAVRIHEKCLCRWSVVVAVRIHEKCLCRWSIVVVIRIHEKCLCR